MATEDDVRAKLQAEGLDLNNVLVGRPSSTRKRPISYWEEFVETDTWYQRKLIEDVPPEEMYAALEDPDLDEDEGEEADGDEDESEEEGEEDTDFVVQDIPSDEENSNASECDSDPESACTNGEEEESV